MFKYNPNIKGISFYGNTLYTSASKIIKITGEKPSMPMDGKTEYEWSLEYQEIPFTIYDWKLGDMIEPNDKLKWHIGARNKEESKLITKILKEKCN